VPNLIFVALLAAIIWATFSQFNSILIEADPVEGGGMNRLGDNHSRKVSSCLKKTQNPKLREMIEAKLA
jgi:hypothetical protein